MRMLARCMVVCLGGLSFAACTERTETVVPAFTGQVIDASTKASLSGVAITDEAMPPHDSWRQESVWSDDSGRFSYPAITLGEVLVFGPGAGYPISRRMTFRAEGYRARVCEKNGFSLFAADTEVRVGLQPQLQRVRSALNQVFLSAGDMVRCLAEIGDAVSDGVQVYQVVRIAELASGGTVVSVRSADGITAERRPYELTLVF
ncbi:hypothetical protein N9H60_04135 [Flavimaricola sp.]|nr:hypothetical protein [Flavimaricola sp.]